MVEWGEGLAEDLADSPLEIRILRTAGYESEVGDADPRTVEIDPLGPRWLGVDLL